MNVHTNLDLTNFRGSAEKKHGFRPACQELPGLSREKNTDFAPLVRNFRGSAEKKRKLQGIS